MKPLTIGVAAFAVLAGLGGTVYLFASSGPEPVAAKPAQAMQSLKNTTKANANGSVDEPPEMAALKKENELLRQQLDNVRAELSKRQHEDAALAEQMKTSAKEGDPKAGSLEELDAKEFWEDAKEAASGDSGDKKQKKERREYSSRRSFSL